MIIMLTIFDNRTHETCNAFWELQRGSERSIERERAGERDIGGTERECASSEKTCGCNLL